MSENMTLPHSTSIPRQPAVKLDTVPLEIISRILGFLGPRDVIRLRSVSKLLYELSHDRMIWKVIYENASFACHPAPFATQPAQFLERSLVRSEWLEHTWTTLPIRFTSIAKVQHSEPFPSSPCTIVHRKWLIVCESARVFMAYDIDSETKPKILWGDWRLRIRSWDACIVVSDEGIKVYIVFSDVDDDDLVTPWKLLEFRTRDDLNYLEQALTLDVAPARTLPEHVRLKGGQGPFCCIVGQNLIFDSRTRTFHVFPEFNTCLIVPGNHISPHIFLTKTHVVQIRTWSDCTLIQSFTPSPDSASLRLCHEAKVQDRIKVLTVIRNLSVDPTSGSENIRFLCYPRTQSNNSSNSVNMSCIDVTLPKRSSTKSVLPMSINVHDIAQIQFEPFDFQRFQLRSGFIPCIHSSHSGHVRGLWHMDGNPENGSPAERIRKFSIDASGNQCIITVGEVTTLSSLMPKDLLDYVYLEDEETAWLDGVTGRLCFVDERDDPSGYANIVVVDVQ